MRPCRRSPSAAPVRVDDADFVSLDRRAAGRDLQRVRMIRGDRQRDVLLLQAAAIDQVDARRHPVARQRQRDRALGHAVHRRHGFGAKAVGRVALDKAADRLRADRLRAVQRVLPRTQVEARERLVRQAAGADLVGEVGRRGNRAAVIVDRLQPALRPREEGLRREHHGGKRVIQRRQPHADQAHVVVQRQPGHHHVLGRESERVSDAADVREQVGVREHHALGHRGAARGVLQQRHVLGQRGTPAGACGSPEANSRRSSAATKCSSVGHALLQQRAGERRDARRDQRAHAGVGEDRRLAAQMILDGIQARGRIDRHRHGPGQQHAEKAAEVILARGQHERDAHAGSDPARAEPGGRRARAPVEFTVAHRIGLVSLEQREVDALGPALDVPGEHVDQSAGRGGRIDGARARRLPAPLARSRAASQCPRRFAPLRSPRAAPAASPRAARPRPAV